MLTQQELRIKSIVEAEEKERIRFARELHDGIGQHSIKAKMNLKTINYIRLM
jgi:two-component system NarL family sensor kinase